MGCSGGAKFTRQRFVHHVGAVNRFEDLEPHFVETELRRKDRVEAQLVDGVGQQQNRPSRDRDWPGPARPLRGCSSRTS